MSNVRNKMLIDYSNLLYEKWVKVSFQSFNGRFNGERYLSCYSMCRFSSYNLCTNRNCWNVQLAMYFFWIGSSPMLIKIKYNVACMVEVCDITLKKAWYEATICYVLSICVWVLRWYLILGTVQFRAAWWHLLLIGRFYRPNLIDRYDGWMIFRRVSGG